MSLVGVQAPKLDLGKSQWEFMAASGLQVFMPLMGVQAPKLDPKKS